MSNEQKREIPTDFMPGMPMEQRAAFYWIYVDIVTERQRQDQKWGGEHHDDRHTDWDWIALITKHTGRAVTEDIDVFREQMIKVAALAVAAIQWANRRGSEEAR